MEIFNALKTEAVLVPAQFVSEFMASASGDYVKVYLWLLKNGGADIEKMAEELFLSEGDVRRAIRYWQDKGVLAGRKVSVKQAQEPAEIVPGPKVAAMEAGDSSLRECYRGTRCTEILNRLSSDTEFKELLLIVQRYLCKILDEKETQVFAYLYDGLKLPADVLDYLVAYAVDHDHANIRYIEKLGTDWAQVGIRDVAAAKRRTKQFEGQKSGKPAAASKDEKASGRRTDYNELVVQEFLQNMGD